MTVIHCPYCNATVNSPLKFCLACGRALSSTDLKKRGGLRGQIKAGITKRLSDTTTHASFRRAKKSYRLQRVLRQFLLNFSYLLIVVLLFYAAVKYVTSEFIVNKPNKRTAPGIKPRRRSQHRSGEPHPFPAIAIALPESTTYEL